jgi:hypothetical protein
MVPKLLLTMSLILTLALAFVLEIGIWNLGFIWNLVLGIWNLSLRIAVSNRFPSIVYRKPNPFSSSTSNFESPKGTRSVASNLSVLEAQLFA